MENEITMCAVFSISKYLVVDNTSFATILSSIRQFSVNSIFMSHYYFIMYETEDEIDILVLQGNET